MPKYEVIVYREQVFRFEVEFEDDDLVRDYCADIIQDGNEKPFKEEWFFDVNEK